MTLPAMQRRFLSVSCAVVPGQPNRRQPGTSRRSQRAWPGTGSGCRAVVFMAAAAAMARVQPRMRAWLEGRPSNTRPAPKTMDWGVNRALNSRSGLIGGHRFARDSTSRARHVGRRIPLDRPPYQRRSRTAKVASDRCTVADSHGRLFPANCRRFMAPS